METTLDAEVGAPQGGDRVVRAAELDPRLRLPAVDEQHDLAGQSADRHRLTCILEHNPRVADRVLDRYARGGAANEALATDRNHLPEQLLLMLGQRPRLPRRLGPADVLVVDVVLQGVEQLVDFGYGVRRVPRRAVPQLLDQHREVSTGEATGLEIGEFREWRQDDPGRGGAAFADQEMHNQVLDCPVSTQRRLALPDLQSQVTQVSTFGPWH